MVDGASGSTSRGSYQGVGVGRRAVEGKDAAGKVLREHALHLVQQAGSPFARRQDLDAIPQLGFADCRENKRGTACAATQSTTAGFGSGRISSETTLVSRTITAAGSVELGRLAHG